MNRDYTKVSEKTLVYKDDGRIGSYFIDDDFSIFAADVADFADIADVKKDDMSMVKASALSEDVDEGYKFKTIVYNSSDNTVVAALGVDITALASPDSDAMFVTSVGTKNDSNGDPATLLKGYVKGELKEIVVPDDAKIENNSNSEFSSFNKGDVIQYSADSNGEASGVSVVFTAAEVINPDKITDGDTASQDDGVFK